MEMLKDALRRLAKAVVVITTQDDAGRYAMSATAVSEVSISPPSMLVCVNQSASLFPALAAGKPFAINILHRSHLSLAQLCSGAVKGEARFAHHDWLEAALPVPRLADAQASIICNNVQKIDHGTHSIFIGEVTEVFVSGKPEPLVYLDGRFTQAI